MLRCVTVLSVIIRIICACHVFFGSSAVWFRFEKPQRKQRKQRRSFVFRYADSLVSVLPGVPILSVASTKLVLQPLTGLGTLSEVVTK